MWNWQRVAWVLRRVRLIKLGYYGAFSIDYVRRLQRNRRYASAHPELVVPSALRRFETNYDTDLERFVEGGREQAESWYRMVKPHLLGDTLDVCEWGCGVGRLIRHMPMIDPEREIRTCGTDYSADLISWCRQNIAGITFTVNGVEPPLPFDDDQFDWVYSSSVLTHLPAELQQAWIDENLRVAKPHGVVLFTLHGNAFKDKLIGSEPREYEQKGVVERAGTGAGEPWFTTYNNPEFVARVLLANHEIVSKVLCPAGHTPPGHDVWVIRSRP